MTQWFVYEWEKPNGKNPTGWFSGHHSRNSTIITTSSYKQGIPSTLPTYNWTFTPIPNRTCSVVTVSLSDAWLPSTWLTVAQIPVRDFKSGILIIVTGIPLLVIAYFDNIGILGVVTWISLSGVFTVRFSPWGFYR